MHLKFETKSNRVKGLAFHPIRPWILASLHNGLIQLWDYRIRTLVDKFDEHSGPVRSVCFHPIQPLFVSGGDDYKIKVWNYKKRRCLFTLLGHLDYVRTVQFHPGECPWILSASDDQTIRIWNWQSRTCLSVLTGHNHYVMCAQWHPREDLVVSASLDQTVRVWDIAGLRKKAVNPGRQIPTPDSDAARLQQDLFGNSDALVKFVLEAHERGVNWAAFHPTQPLIISGADDRLLKLWRVNESRAWEVDSFRGHFHNVSCVVFHPRYDIVVSDSEDKTIRAWDLNKRTSLQTFRRENDRFWILAAHPTQNVVAAGHDSGLVLFKLVSERVPVAVAGSQFLYVSNNMARAYDISSARDIPICTLRSRAQLTPLSSNPAFISFSASDRALIACHKADGGQYELYILPSDSNRGGEALDSRKGTGQGAAFVGRKRFAVLDKRSLVVRDLTNTEVKRVPLPVAADWLFPGPAVGTVLLRIEDRVAVFDIQQRRITAEATVPGVRHVVWSGSGSGQPQRVALLAKDTVTIASSKLELLGSVHELIRVKSAAWDESGVLIYTTLSHLKYMLPQNGDHGTVRALETPLYLASVRGNKCFCVDREGSPRVLVINPTEYVFKLALAQKRYADVLRMVREANLVGAALVAYLQQRGFPEIALHFVRDDRLRFDLALECGNIDAALDAARALNDPRCWRRLAQAALAQGNHQVVEMAYQRVRDFARLSFLYSVTGNTDKLRKMLKIAEMRADVESVFHNALYLGDVEERARALAGAGLPQLAYLVAASHGLEALADTYARQTLETTADGELPAVSPMATLLFPPLPIVRAGDSNWPLLNVSKGWADALLASEAAAAAAASSSAAASTVAPIDASEVEAEGDAAWGGDGAEEMLGLGSPGTSATSAAGMALTPAPTTDGWDTGEQLDALKELDAVAGPASASGKAAAAAAGGFYVPPVHGADQRHSWLKGSSLAIDHAAAGDPESAGRLLQVQVGAGSIAPLREAFVNTFMGAEALLPGIACAPPMRLPLQRNEATLQPTPAGRLAGLPVVAGSSSVQQLAQRLREAYSMFTRGQFPDSLAALRELLHSALCTVAGSRQEADELRELRGICREYAVALLIELSRRDLVSKKEEPARQVELAAYLTHQNLQLPHLVLVLRAAMNSAFANKDYAAAAGFARRLLELNPKQDIAATAQKVCQYSASTQAGPDAHTLRYDERNPFTVCAFDLVPIYRGSPISTCPYCGAGALPDHAGKLCPVCQIGTIGRTDATGFQCYRPS